MVDENTVLICKQWARIDLVLLHRGVFASAICQWVAQGGRELSWKAYWPWRGTRDLCHRGTRIVEIDMAVSDSGPVDSRDKIGQIYKCGQG